MDDDKRLESYGASYSFDRPPPYDASDCAIPGPGSSYTYNSLTPDNQMKPTAPKYQSVNMMSQPNPLAVNNVQIHISDKFGPYPQNAICPHCNQYVITKTKPVTGALTWFTCLGLMLIGCFVCCCLIPFCCNSCRNVDHSCPNCRRKIGHYSRSC